MRWRQECARAVQRHELQPCADMRMDISGEADPAVQRRENFVKW